MVRLMDGSSRLWKRILTGISFPGLIVLVAVYLIRAGGGLHCIFHDLTGLYCPGCGSGRAMSSLIEGHPAKMLSYNCMLVFLGLPCSLVFIHEYLRLVLPGLGLRPVHIPQRLLEGIMILLILFWILRNIPSFSFLALA